MSFQLSHQRSAETIKTVARDIQSANLDHGFLLLNFRGDFAKNFVGPTCRRCKIREPRAANTYGAYETFKLCRSLVTHQQAQQLQRVIHLASAMFCRKRIDDYSARDRLGW